MPALRAAFAVAVEAPFFKVHRGRENQVGAAGAVGRIDVRDDHEVFRIARGAHPVRVVRGGLEDVDDLRPDEVDRLVFEAAQDFHEGRPDLRVERAFGELPDRLGLRAVLRVRNQHVGGESVAEGADFTGGAAG